MGFDFNENTDDGADPRPTWGGGIRDAGDGWEQRSYAPVHWQWTSGDNLMLIGFYDENWGDGVIARTRWYNEPGDYATGGGVWTEDNCNKAWKIHYVRIMLNKNRLDGTPPWFFKRLVEHELGHAFGLCEASGTQIPLRESTMFPPHPSQISGCTYMDDNGDGNGGYDFNVCFHKAPSNVSTLLSWDADPPEQTWDFGSSTCANGTKIEGVKCVYNK